MWNRSEGSKRPARRFFSNALSLPACLLSATAAIGSGCGALGNPELPFQPEEAALHDVRAYVKSGLISCRQMLSRYQLLHDSLDPAVHALVTWNDHLLADADRLDQVPREQRGSFHCVPIVLKDNLDFEGLPTSGGATALSKPITGSSAEAVERLLTAGAIVLGKTNMPDFALDGVNTLSSMGGQTTNPYNQAMTVYGSSGGTAAAISASLGIIGLGTDTYGSLVQPASATGLVAIRPTQGLVSATGVLPLMSQQDMPGPMARRVEDAAAALELLVDKHFADQGSQNYTSNLSEDALRGLTIGYDPAVLQALPAPMLLPSQEVSDLFSKTLANLRQGGAVTRQVSAFGTLFPSLQAATDASFQCMPVDFKQSINSYLTTQRPESPLRSLADILGSGQFLSSVRTFLTGAQAQTDTIETSAACQQYRAARIAAHDAVTALMDKEGLDLLVVPAANQPVFPISETPPPGWFGFQILSSPTGLPSLTMPMGVAPKSGAPVGLIFVSRSYQESKLVSAAYAFQSQFQPRVAPPSATW